THIRSNAELSISGSVDSNFDQAVSRTVTPGHHSMMKGFGHSEKSFLQADSTDPQKHVFHQGGVKAGRNTSSQYLHNNDFDGTRMAYLREKLRECLSSCSLEHNAFSSNTVTPLKDSEGNLKRTSSNTQTVTRAASAGTSRTRPVCGLVKSNDRPLVRFAGSHNFREPYTIRDKRTSDAPPDSLLDCVLEAFPKLELDSHDRRLFRRKAGKFTQHLPNLMGIHRSLGVCSTTDKDETEGSYPMGHKLTWIEERQRRRLAQMIRHDAQFDRLREQRASEAADRRVRKQARERRHQLIRARNYYRHFVHEFRARKVAKIIEEEQVFRRFFEQLLAQERDNLRELQKLERDEKNRKENQVEEELSCLDHGHRTRVGLMSEVMEREHSKRLALIRQEQAELTSRKRELRKALEANIREMQQNLLTNKDTAYFRQKDADRIIEHPRDFVF
ncbi:Centrosomal protein of 95 kDa, partial [Paragonimus westermani]